MLEERTMSKEIYAIRGTHGFIGERLVTRLEGDGHTVINIPRDWVNAPAADVYVGMAAYGNSYEQKDPIETYRVNVMENLRLLQDADEDCRAVVLVSTSSVLIPHQTFYSASKKAMEEMAQLYSREYNLPIAVVRPSTVTGIGEQPHRLIPRLIKSCLYGEEIPFVPQPTHDFIDVDDFLTGLIFVADNIRDYRSKRVNLSSGRSYTNDQVRRMVEQETGRPANVRLVESLRSYDTDQWVVEPTIPELPIKPLEQSIREMVEHELKRANH